MNRALILGLVITVSGILACSAAGADTAPVPVPPTAPASAPSGASAVPKSTSPPRGSENVVITGDDGFRFEGQTGRVVFHNATVLDPEVDPKLILKCKWLSAMLAPGGKTFEEIVAMTNVVIQIKEEQETKTARGQHAVYKTAEDTLTLTGNPEIEMAAGLLIGDKEIIFDRRKGTLEAPGKTRMVGRPGSSTVLTPSKGTNRVGQTNASPAPVPTAK